MRTFRIVMAGHGTLPAALLATAELICGPIADMAAVGLEPTESPDHYAEGLRAAIGRDGRRVLVLCDLLGGTPFNVGFRDRPPLAAQWCASPAPTWRWPSRRPWPTETSTTRSWSTARGRPGRHRRDGAPPRPARLLAAAGPRHAPETP